MEVDLPAPGTLPELLEDAAAVGWRTNERMLRDWTGKGLLAAPERRSLGRGHGQAPGLYSSKQRAMFRWLAEHRAQGARNERLAAAVIYTWLYHEDDWVSSDQALPALRTVVGNPKKSDRLARRAAESLVSSIDLRADPAVLRKALSDELRSQLQRGRIDSARLRRRLAAVFDLPGIVVVRGPVGAQLSADILVDLLATRAAGVARLPATTVAEMAAARHEHRVTWAQYSAARPALYQEAAADIKQLFAERSGQQLLDGAAPAVLYLLGVLDRRPDLVTQWGRHDDEPRRRP